MLRHALTFPLRGWPEQNSEPNGSVVWDRACEIQPVNIIVDGTPATMFFGKNLIMGDTQEVWFIKNGFLYEVTTYKELDQWLAGIMKTWKFM